MGFPYTKVTSLWPGGPHGPGVVQVCESEEGSTGPDRWNGRLIDPGTGGTGICPLSTLRLNSP